jgi:hypothetical protein
VPSNPWNKFEQNPELKVLSIAAVDARLLTCGGRQRVSTISGEELQQHPGLNSLSMAAVDAHRKTWCLHTKGVHQGHSTVPFEGPLSRKGV